MNSRVTIPGLLVLSTLACGCTERQQTYAVLGMVVYPDGKPLTRGTVEFELIVNRNRITAAGDIAPDGTFQLGTFESTDGAIAGQHRVAVIADHEIGTEAERPGLMPPGLLDPRFSDFETSGLIVEVGPRLNNILVQVDYAPPPEADEGSGDGQTGDAGTGIVDEVSERAVE